MVAQPLLVHAAVPFGVLGHAVPQAPQFCGSFLVSTQAFPQRMKGSVHWKLQLPAHTGLAFAGALQLAPHLPQLEVSVPRFTQDPLQFVCVPQSVVHSPALHTEPVPHAVPHLPQSFESDCRSMQDAPQGV
ncbi:MAG: hypothetical protein ABJB12_01705 [Pseudomonadota bacterium]